MRSWIVLILLTASLIAALSTGYPLLFRLVYVLGAILIVSFCWAWLNVRWSQLERKMHSEATHVGQYIEERFTIRNTGLLPKLWLEVHDHSSLPGHWASTALNLATGQYRSWKVRTLCQQRGRFTLGPVELVSGDPFGLFRRKRRLGLTSQFIVYPRLLDLSSFELPAGELPGESRWRRRTHHITPNASGVREYAPGDSYNRIHWPSTARLGKIMVKEFELDPSSDVWIFLDMEERVHTGTQLESTEEYAVTIAASLSKRFLDAHRSSGLVTYGQHHEVLHSDKGNRQLSKILESLAVVQAKGRTPLAELIVAESHLLGRNTGLVIITPSTDESWVSALQHLTARGVKALVILLEARTFGEADSSLMVVSRLAAGELPTYLIKHGDNLEQALSGPSVGLGRGK